MDRLFRKFVRSQPVLYKAVRLIRAKEMLYPNSGTRITIEGYPRSGNTFAYYIARSLSSPEFIASHYHNIATLKASISLNIPTVVLVRNPLASVSSLALMDSVRGGARDISILLDEWIDYYSYVERNCGCYILFDFRQLVSDPDSFGVLIDRLMRLDLDYEEIQSRVRNAEVALQSKEGQKSPQASSMPVSSREVAKEEVKEDVRCLPAFQDALTLWGNLIGRLSG